MKHTRNASPDSSSYSEDVLDTLDNSSKNNSSLPYHAFETGTVHSSNDADSVVYTLANESVLTVPAQDLPGRPTAVENVSSDEYGYNNVDYNSKDIDEAADTDSASNNIIGTLLHNNRAEDNLIHLSDNSTALEQAYEATAASFREPNTFQKLIAWVACFSTPFLISMVPDSVRLPVVLEILQPSMSCFAASVLCIVLIATQISNEHDSNYINIMDSVLSSQSEFVYIFLVPILMWSSVYLIIMIIRSKTMSVLSCIFILFSYVRILQVAYGVEHNSAKEMLVFLGFVNAVYLILTITFCRAENKAIQMGWAADREDDLYDDEYLSDCETRNSAHMDNYQPQYTIDDVLERVTADIELSERVLHASNNTSTVTSSTPVPVQSSPEQAFPKVDQTSTQKSPTVQPLCIKEDEEYENHHTHDTDLTTKLHTVDGDVAHAHLAIETSSLNISSPSIASSVTKNKSDTYQLREISLVDNYSTRTREEIALEKETSFLLGSTEDASDEAPVQTPKQNKISIRSAR
jgi:hypothetical protein